MNIICTNCQRRFDVDESRLGETKAAMCECGTRLYLGSSPQDNTRLGKYNLIHRVATGGMGEIFYGKSSGVEGFEREVAIKRMLPHLSAERSFIDMMIKEAKLTVLLNHPNIVQIYDLSKQGEQYYIAMEYVPGITVGNLLEDAHKTQKLLPLEVAVHITLQLLAGLGYAHNFTDPKGVPLSIVHRDITPQNILVTSRAFVKITDFGIAKAVNEISTTSPGMIKGKLGYIAPEQLSGVEPDHRVDLFCAAILLWEMLAVRRLFKGNTEVETFGLIAQAHIPPLDAIRKDVPPALWTVLQRALAKNPADRYPTAETFAEAINQAIFPRVATAYAQGAIAYFAANPQLFAGVYQPDATVAVSDDAQLAPVKTYTRIIAPPRQSVSPVLLGLGLVVGLGVAVGGYLWTSRGAAPPAASGADTAASQAKPSVAPTPATAPAPPTAPAAGPPPVAAPTVAPAAAPAPAIAPAPAPAEPPPDASVAAPAARRRPAHAAKESRDDVPLTGKEIQAVIVHNQAALARCLNQIDRKSAPTQVAAHIAIGTAGHVDEVTFTPELTGPAHTCLQTALMALRFRKHPVEGLKVTIPLKIQVL